MIDSFHVLQTFQTDWVESQLNLVYSFRTIVLRNYPVHYHSLTQGNPYKNTGNLDLNVIIVTQKLQGNTGGSEKFITVDISIYIYIRKVDNSCKVYKLWFGVHIEADKDFWCGNLHVSLMISVDIYFPHFRGKWDGVYGADVAVKCYTNYTCNYYQIKIVHQWTGFWRKRYCTLLFKWFLWVHKNNHLLWGRYELSLMKISWICGRM